MDDIPQLDGYTLCEAAEEVAHEIRSRQLNILTLIQLMQKMDSGELDVTTLKTTLDMPTGFSSIKESVHEISDLVDTLIVYIREQENP
ncbi:MAG: hypothetical protein Phog2KO_11000 [Phototrophicaceae bacterium]